MRRAIVSGSFDPITYGHLYVIEKAFELADEVVVILATNPSKQGFIPEPLRSNLIFRSIKEELPRNVIFKIETLPKGMLLVEMAKRVKADFIVRGIRNTTDFEYENQLNLVQKKIAKIETFFVLPPRHMLEVSSSLIRSCMPLDEWKSIVEGYVPKCVLEELERLHREK